MKWSISQLNKIQSKGLTIDEMVDVSDLKDINKDIRDVSLVHVVGRADIGSSEITFHLTISGSMILPCSRTLVDVSFPFHIQTKETFIIHGYEYDTDEDVNYVEGETIDLLPLIKENILLEIPMQIFYEGDHVEGAAPQSGQDWEVIQENPGEKKIDPRLAGLAKYFDKKSE